MSFCSCVYCSGFDCLPTTVRNDPLRPSGGIRGLPRRRAGRRHVTAGGDACLRPLWLSLAPAAPTAAWSQPSSKRRQLGLDLDWRLRTAGD